MRRYSHVNEDVESVQALGSIDFNVAGEAVPIATVFVEYLPYLSLFEKVAEVRHVQKVNVEPDQKLNEQNVYFLKPTS